MAVVNRVENLCRELAVTTAIVQELVNFLHLACHYFFGFSYPQIQLKIIL